MKEKVKEIVENNNLTKKQFFKAMEELNISEIEALKLLKEIHEEICDKTSMFIYEQIYAQSILRGKTDTEILTGCIEVAKTKVKKAKKAVVFNYIVVGFVGLNVCLGGYELLYEKIIGIVTLLLTAYNHHNYTRRKQVAKDLLADLCRVEETLPKLRCTTKDSQKIG